VYEALMARDCIFQLDSYLSLGSSRDRKDINEKETKNTRKTSVNA
jgi:hypothetical protein